MAESVSINRHEGWQATMADQLFTQPIQEIIDELTEINKVRYPHLEDYRPASLGKYYLFDLLQERRPDLFEQFSPKVIKACIFLSMLKLGYNSPSHRRKAFWREDV